MIPLSSERDQPPCRRARQALLVPTVMLTFRPEFVPLLRGNPMDGACSFLILPAADTECFQISSSLGKRFSRQHILLILDRAPNHTTDDLLIPANITLEFLPPCSPELNPQENIWDKIHDLQELCSQVDGQ